jgi:SAM-dependent methyltransferase
MPSSKKPFDKYDYYLRSVQSPEEDAIFFRDAFIESFPGKKPLIFREDFCGTFALCCEWVKLNARHAAIGLDLDKEPLEYGKTHLLSQLSPAQQKRINLREANVLGKKLPQADIIGALNFSYFLFKDRKTLLNYFENCYRALRNPGLLIIDCFGGPSTLAVNEDRTDHGEFVYYWDQSTFNPVTHESLFHIHFRIKGEKRREKVFTYDWRLWTLPELTDLLRDAGFKKVHVYWEGTTKKGEGDGVFKRSNVGDDSEGWIAYLTAEKS